MIHENTFKSVDFDGAKGLVFIHNKILTYRRDSHVVNSPNCIDLPGGGREGNESPFETFQREIKEEFGIVIQKENITFSCTIQSFFTPSKYSFFIVAKTSYEPEDIVFGNEGSEWLLMTPDEFISRTDGIQRQQKRIKCYQDGKLTSV